MCPLAQYLFTSIGGLMTLVLLAISCQDLRRTMTEIYPMSYDVPQALASAELLYPVLSDLSEPTDVVFPTENRLWITEKSGKVRSYLLKDGQYQEQRHLLQVSVRTSSEQGLLALTPHPNFQKNALIYTHYNPKSGSARGVVTEWKVDTTSDNWTAKEQREVFSIEQPYANHNGGQILFGPDDMLYIGLGDGGWRDDPHGHGQNRNTLLGTILRIDPTPDKNKPYTIPKDNPFQDSEIFMYGLRNPWRFSFLEDGRIIVGDVGQNAYEEISIGSSGDNMGWNHMEGNHCFPDEDHGCDTSAYVSALWEYPHSVGQSVTGGVQILNKGPNHGGYLFGDFTSGKLWSLEIPKKESVSKKESKAELLGRFSILPVAFGRDHRGDVYLADFQGHLYQIKY